MAGDGTVTLGSESAPIQTGDALAIRLGERQSIAASGADGLQLLIVGVSRNMDTKNALMMTPPPRRCRSIHPLSQAGREQESPMPRPIYPPAAPEYDLAEVAARLDESGVDLSDEAGIARCAQLLAGLARNRGFLADRIIAELKASYADQLAVNRYSAQVFLLHRSPRGFFLRANLWPAATDAVYAASGAAAPVVGPVAVVVVSVMSMLLADRVGRPR